MFLHLILTNEHVLCVTVLTIYRLSAHTGSIPVARAGEVATGFRVLEILRALTILDLKTISNIQEGCSITDQDGKTGVNLVATGRVFSKIFSHVFLGFSSQGTVDRRPM